MTSSNHHSTDLETILELYILDRTPSNATIDSFRRFIRIFQNDTNITDINEINKHQLNLWKQLLLKRVNPR